MSEDESLNLVPVTWVKQYHFCPRIVYFIGVLGFDERITESMIEGREEHVSEDEREARRKTLGGGRKEKVRARWSKLRIASERLGLFGIVDEVVETDKGLAVVEVKWAKAPKRPHPGHIYQAAAYAMLAEEEIRRPVRRAVMIYAKGKRSFEVEVTDDVRRHVLWTVRRIKRIVESELPPMSASPKRCANCGFLKVCGGAMVEPYRSLTAEGVNV